MLSHITCLLGTGLIITGVGLKISKNTPKKKPVTAIITTVIGISLVFISAI